ncbi:MAG: hypothetical protein ACXQT3_04135 [Methermicoccaceae archaeon]
MRGRMSVLEKLLLLIGAIIIALIALKLLSALFWIVVFLLLVYVAYRLLEGWVYRRH